MASPIMAPVKITFFLGTGGIFVAAAPPGEGAAAVLDWRSPGAVLSRAERTARMELLKTLAAMTEGTVEGGSLAVHGSGKGRRGGDE